MKTSNKLLVGLTGILLLTIIGLMIFVRVNLIPIEAIKPSGNVVKETKTFQPYASLSLNGPFAVELIKGGNTLEIEGDEAFLQKMEIKNEEDRLSISIAEQNTIDKIKAGMIKLKLGYGDLQRISVSKVSAVISSDTIRTTKLYLSAVGSARIDLKVDAQRITARASGSGMITINGQTEELEAYSSGSADIYADKINCQNAKIRSSGSSEIHVNAMRSFDMNAVGSSEISYRGDGEVIKQSRSGAGRIRKMD